MLQSNGTTRPNDDSSWLAFSRRFLKRIISSFQQLGDILPLACEVPIQGP
jgi:hypothetical protein